MHFPFKESRASTLCETPEKTEFFLRLAESNGTIERRKDDGERKRLTRRSKRWMDVAGASRPLADRFNWHHLWWRFYIWQRSSCDASRSWIEGNSCSLCNPCAATSNTHVRPVGLENGIRSTAPLVVLAVRVLAHDAPASALQPSCFDPLHLPRSAAQMSSSDRAGLQRDPVPLKHGGETKDPSSLSCVLCFDKPSTQQQQQTTGG